jgi:hypothetical protein
MGHDSEVITIGTNAQPDPLRRFTPVPLGADFMVMGRTVRLETNNERALGIAQGAFERFGGLPSSRPAFLWKVICEPDVQTPPKWDEWAAFSEEGLRFVSLGARSFLVMDMASRCAVSFLPEGLVDEANFVSAYLSTLFHLTAPALGLTVLSAASVALGRSGLLIFGPPKSGKTTSCYLAGKSGLEFHADMASFLELENGRARAWGEFWPSAFRPDALEYLPELREITRPFSFGESSFLHLEKNPSTGSTARSVVPVACVFLERESGKSPQVIRLSRTKLAMKLRNSLPFEEDTQFQSQQAAVFQQLDKLPAYRLIYGDDPGIATIFYRSLLTTHRLPETSA